MRLSWQHQPATGRGKIGDGTFGWQLITSLASGRMESPGRQGMGKGAGAGEEAGSGAADGAKIGL